MKKATALVTLGALSFTLLSCLPALRGHESPYDPNGTFTAGKTWTMAAATSIFLPRTGHTVSVFNNKIWVIGGGTSGTPDATNDVWYSSDGVTWGLATAMADFPNRFGHQALVFNNKLWVIGGYATDASVKTNDVWSSSDGSTWTKACNAAFERRSQFSATVHNGKMWVSSGIPQTGPSETNDVWYSSDGITWIIATASAEFAPRRQPTFLSHDNKLWIIGGRIAAGGANDVWNSTDGVHWTQVTTSGTMFPPREMVGGACVHKNRMVIAAGDVFPGGIKTNDVWYSTDGITWAAATYRAAFDPRYGAGLVSYREKLWMIGGYLAAIPWRTNDVWYSE